MNDRELRSLKPFVQEWITASIRAAGLSGTGTTTASTGATGGSGFTEADALALFYTQTQINTYRATHEGNEDAHHPRSHPFLGSDHSYPSALAGSAIWTADGSSYQASKLPHENLDGITENDHHNRLHGMESALDHSFPAIYDQLFGLDGLGDPEWFDYSSDVNVTDGQVGAIIKATNSGGHKATYVELTNYVKTKRIYGQAGDHLYLNPDTANGYDILWDGQADLVSDNHVSGVSGVLLRPSTGLIDTYKIQVKELYAEAFIVQAKRAENGAIIITPGVTQLSRPFTIPNAGSSGIIYVNDYSGLPGYDVFQVNDDVRIHLLQESEILVEPLFVESDSAYDTGDDGGGVFFTTDFEGASVGTDTGSDWKETGDGNVLTVDDTMYFISDPPSAGTRAIDNSGTGVNSHIHYNGTGAASLTNYRVTGKVYIDGNTCGWTIGSAYTDGTPADEYYRVRFYNSGTIHMDNHGSVGVGAGTTTSALVPASDTLHNFKIEFENTGTQTEIRFKIWEDGQAEPGTWLIDAYDDTANRRTAGTFGFWSYNGSTQTWYIEEVTAESLTPTTPTNPSVTLNAHWSSLENDVYLFQVVAECDDLTDLNFSGPSLSLINSTNVGGHVHALYWYRLQADGGDGAWTVDLNGTAFYGTITVAFVAYRNVVETGTPYESNNSASTASGTSINIPADSGLTEGSTRVTMLAQHNIAGAVEIFDSPNSWTQRMDVRSSTQHSIQGEEYKPGAGVTTTPSTNWTVSPARAYSAIYVALTPAPPIAGSFTVTSAYGRISAVNVVYNLTGGEQAHQFTTKTNSPGQGATAAIDATVLNYQDYTGTNDPGVIELTTLDQAGSPYMQMGIRQEYNSTLQRIPLDVRLRIGKLDGIAGYGPEEWGLVVFGSDNGFDGAFAITNKQMTLDNVPFYQTDGVGSSTVDIVPGEGIVLFSGNNWANDDDRKLTFRDKDTLAVVEEMGSWNAGSERYWVHEWNAGTVEPYAGGFYHWVQNEMTASGSGQRLQWRIAVNQNNPFQYASMTIKVADDRGENDISFQADTYFFDIRDKMTLEADNMVEFTGPNVAPGNEVYMSEYHAGSGIYSMQFNISEIRMRETTAGFGAGRSLEVANSQGNLAVFRGWDSYNYHLRYMWFRGSFYASEGAFIASTNNDSSTNIDHMWHDDGGNRWHFVSDSTWKAGGNSGVGMGTLFLKYGTANTNLSGYGRLWVDGSGVLKYTNAAGTTKSVQLV